MSNSVIIFQTAGETIPNLPEGQALMFIGIFLALTAIAVKLASAIALFTWGVTGVMLVLLIVGLISAPFYWGTVALAFMGSISSVLYTANNA